MKPKFPYLEEGKKELPWQRPKSLNEDAQAHKRIKKIVNNPGYIIAEKDTDFLQEEDTRGIRLALDYRKAEMLLKISVLRYYRKKMGINIM